MNFAGEWFSGADLAGLPGVPEGRSKVTAKGNREGWQSRTRAGKGGGLEYHIDSLPQETRDYIIEQRCDDALPKAVEAPATKTERRQRARLEILDYINRWCDAKSIEKRVDCDTAFAAAYNAREIDFPDWIYETVKRLGRSTICNWRKALKTGDPTALRGNYGTNKGRNIIDSWPEFHDYCIGAIAEHPHIGGSMLRLGLISRFGKTHGGAIPSETSVRRWLNDWKTAHPAEYMLLADPDGYRNKFASKAGSRSEGITYPNQRWELDSTWGDVMLQPFDWQQGKPGKPKRYNIVGCIDVYTRRVRMLVSPTSKASSVIALLRRCILEWGIPTQIKTDNGKDYTATHVAQAMQALEVEQILCPPFSPDHKPHVERFFKTFNHGLIELQPGYVGHDVAQRKAIEGRKSFSHRFGGGKEDKTELLATPQELQKFCDLYCQYIYGTKTHSKTGQAPEHAAQGFIKREVPDAESLINLMLPGGERTVNDARIRLNNTVYLAPELGARAGKVHIRMPDDMGVIHVYEDASCTKFICTAEAPELTGNSRKVIALKTKQVEKATTRAHVKAAKKVAKEQDSKGIGAEIRDHLLAEAETLATMPQDSEVAQTAAFEAAAELKKGLEPKATPLHNPDRARLMAESAAIEAAQAQAQWEQEWLNNPAALYFRYWRRLSRGTDVDARDLVEMAKYRTTSVGREIAASIAEDMPIDGDPLAGYGPKSEGVQVS
jgi:putative transposase